MSETSKTIEQQLEEIAKVRAERIKQAKSEALTLKQQNQLKLAEIERATKKTLGLDLGVVWLSNGEMIVVQKPSPLIFEQHQLKVSQGKDVTAEDIDTVLSGSPPNSALIYPAMAQIESMVEQYPDCKLVASSLAIQLGATSEQDLGGKS